jgi:hypothetical protein
MRPAETSARGTIDDMLTEAGPRACLPEEVAGGDWSADTGGPIGLLNRAWAVYEVDPDQYPQWEADAIRDLLA